MEPQEIKETLEQLGYKLTPDRQGWRSSPIYRESHNPTSLKIYNNGSFVDYSAGLKGGWLELIRLSTGLQTIEAAQTWLQSKGKAYIANKTPIIPKLKMAKTFPKEMLENLFPEHDYWINRGISLDTLKTFKGGFCKTTSRFKGYYVFPIWNSKNDIIGFAGRDVTESKKIRWRLCGNKSEWRYPLFINYSIIKAKKECIIIEGIGDSLALWDVNIKNTIVLFGVEMSLSVLNLLLKLELNKIIIALNNDGGAGNNGAEKLYNRLLKYFNKSQIEIKLPIKKDFAEMSIQERIQWKQNNLSQMED